MPEYREKCLSEKEERCAICGSDEAIQIHHVDGDRSNNSIENLEPLCNSCHSSVHAGVEGFEEWTRKLLPDHERKRTVTITLSSSLSRQLEVVRQTSPAETDPDAVRFAIRDRADSVDGLQSVLGSVDELRHSPVESDAMVIQRALRYREEAADRYAELLAAAGERGSLTASEIADILDTDELPVEAETSWSVGNGE